MNVFDDVTGRKKILKFRETPVDDKMIGVMLYAATHAHSAGEQQEWHFVVVRDEKIRKKLSEASLHNPIVKTAPVNIVVCADIEKMRMRFDKRGEVFYSVQDTAAASMILMIAATALGLDSEWVSSLDEEWIKDILDLPDNFRPVAIISVGYAAEKENLHTRLPFENLTWNEKYGNKYDISYIVQPGAKKDVDIKPIGNAIEDAIKKYREKEKRFGFRDFLKKIFR